MVDYEDFEGRLYDVLDELENNRGVRMTVASDGGNVMRVRVRASTAGGRKQEHILKVDTTETVLPMAWINGASDLYHAYDPEKAARRWMREHKKEKASLTEVIKDFVIYQNNVLKSVYDSISDVVSYEAILG